MDSEVVDFLNSDASADVSTANIEEVLQALNGHTSSGNRGTRRQRRGNRMKVFDNGYIFTYDKDSQCGQRSFWRCERKSECPARVHTNPATNQIIKRINEHTHDAPNRDDLPPWLILNQTDPGSGEGEDKEASPVLPAAAAMPGTTGVLLPYSSTSAAAGSSNLQLNQLIERELEQELVTAGSPTAGAISPIGNCAKAGGVAIPQLFIKSDPEAEDVTVGPPKKKKAKMGGAKKDETSAMVEQMLAQPDQFWEMFEATKKTISWLKNTVNDGRPSSDSNRPVCNEAVASFLDKNNLSDYKTAFSRYTMESLRSLSSSDCVSACDNTPDGLLLYHALRASKSHSSPSPSSSFPSSDSLVIFVSPSSSSSDDDPLYEMINLRQKTQSELRELLLLRGIITDDVTRLSTGGPAGISVQLADEIITSWPSDSVFRCTVTRGIAKLSKVAAP